MNQTFNLNNNISKLFSAVMCERLYALSEKAGWLGQVQNGFRRSRQALDSIFILRTILEKSSQISSKPVRDLSLLFIDLQKAYDTVPRDRLWIKLENLGIGKHFISVK